MLTNCLHESMKTLRSNNRLLSPNLSLQYDYITTSSIARFHHSVQPISDLNTKYVIIRLKLKTYIHIGVTTYMIKLHDVCLFWINLRLIYLETLFISTVPTRVTICVI